MTLKRLGAVLLVAALVATAGCSALPTGDAAPERPNETYFTHEGQALTLHPDAGETVSGHLNESRSIDAVTVRLRSSDSESPFLNQAGPLNVSGDDTFSATMNLSGVEANTTFVATVLHGNETLTETEGRVVSE